MLQLMPEIDDSEKPYVEYLAGRAVPKEGMTRTHGKVEARLWAILFDLADKRGDIATEWRCYLPKEERTTSLVPDVAFISHERLAGLSYQEQERPHFAPDTAVEVRSPDESRRVREWKIAAYLRYGAKLVLDVDPEKRTIIAHDATGVRVYGEGDTVTCDALPWLTLDVRAAFADLG